MLVRSPRLLHARGVQKRFGRKLVLDDAGLELYAGEAVALVGENGAGKTTLLRICAGLLRPDTGHVEVAARLGYAPQEPGVFDLLNADEHLELFGAGMGLGASRARDEGQAVLHQLGFPVGSPAVARNLSGGTRQKLNLALALLGDPALLVLDEPYQGFDRGTYVSFWDLVDQWRAAGKGVLVVTHLLSELNRVDRVIELRVAPAQSAAGS